MFATLAGAAVLTRLAWRCCRAHPGFKSSGTAGQEVVTAAGRHALDTPATLQDLAARKELRRLMHNGRPCIRADQERGPWAAASSARSKLGGKRL
jgi:hypothetical protein